MKIFFVIISILFIFISSNTLIDNSINIEWEKLEEGLFYSKKIYGHGITKGYIHFLKISYPRKIRILHNNFNKISLSKLEEIYKPLVIVNGGYFQPNYRPAGLLKVNGKVLYPININGHKGILGINENNIDIFDKKYYENKKKLFKDMLQNGPLLIENNKLGIYSDNKDYRARTALCIDNKKNLFIIVADTLASISLWDLANILIDKNINCKKAINLDGGSSTGLRINLNKKRIVIEPSVKISNAIGVF